MRGRRLWLGVVCLCVCSCGQERYSGAERAEEVVEPAPDGRVDAPGTRSKALVIHEWGTFTSMQSSVGAVLEGMHHEEESLPAFVYARDIGSPYAKRIESLPEGVTQKLETPVIYFYTDDAVDVRVDVGFPQGVISEWYPQATGFTPEVGGLTRMGEGSMQWDVSVIPASADLIEVPADDVWAPSRLVDAAPVQFGDESEMFIFYRGLGRFEVPIRVTSQSQIVRAENLSDDPIQAAFLLHVHEGGGSITPMGAIAPHTRVTASPSPKELDIDAYVAQAADTLSVALIESGLYEDEAIAMVDTWSRSYFRTPGLRVLYIVPRTWTDRLLPIAITPEPDELVRTLVGRVEVLTPEAEQALVEQVRQSAADHTDFPMESLSRFAEPRLRRTAELIDDPEIQTYLEGLIERASAQP